MNLFATVELLGVDGLQADSGMGVGFDTPVIDKKQSGDGFREKGGNVSSVGSKTNFINLDDFKLVQEVEKLEERMKAESNTTGACDFSGCSEGIDSDYSGSEEIDEKDVRPRGYDYEFWEPLIAGDLGCSNPVEVVFNDKEAEGLVKMEEARRPYSCYTNNAFDHMVDLGGSSEWGRADNKDEEPMDDFAWMGKTSLGRNETVGQETRGRETGGHGSSKRNLVDVDDEEFDIPPLYDDTEYEAAEIPELDVEEADGVVHFGKVYGSKVDCQISLAIYAIKNQIQFKQTRTKLDSFVCGCPDTGCDWRVTTHEIHGTGYYEIRKAQLVHFCPIESRNG